MRDTPSGTASSVTVPVPAFTRRVGSFPVTGAAISAPQSRCSHVTVSPAAQTSGSP